MLSNLHHDGQTAGVEGAVASGSQEKRKIWANFTALLKGTWDSCCQDATFAVPGFLVLVSASIALAVSTRDATELVTRPICREFEQTVASATCTFVGGVAVGFFVMYAFTLLGNPSIRKHLESNAALMVFVVSAFYFIFVASAVSPVICVHSIGGRGELRPQSPTQYVYWLCQAPSMLMALMRMARVPTMSQRISGVAFFLVCSCWGVASFTETFALWLVAVVFATLLSLFVFYLLLTGYLVALRQSSDAFTRDLLRWAGPLAVISWSCFPGLWYLGQFSVISPYIEWILWPVIDFFTKCLIALVMALGVFVRHVNETHRELSESELRRQEAQVNKDAATRQFLRWTLHELRVPLQGALLAVEELRDGIASGQLVPLPSAAVELAPFREAGESAVSAILAVSKLLDDFLSMSKIESGRLILEPVDLPLRPWVAEATSVFTNSLRAKGIQLHVDTSPDVPRAIRADGNRLQQVLSNYLSNAIKFSSPARAIILRLSVVDRLPTRIMYSRLASAVSSNSLNVAVTDSPVAPSAVTPAAASARFLRVSVEDNGPGIAPDEISLLFQPYNQIRAGSQQKGGGTGLGLALCKKIIELAGGAVGVTSEPGKGSQFWFEVPLVPVVLDTLEEFTSTPVSSAIATGEMDSSTLDVAGDWTKSTTADIAPGVMPESTRPASPPSLTHQAVVISESHSHLHLQLRQHPRAIHTAAAISPAAAEASQRRLCTVRRAVVVDDVYTNRELFARQLKRLGCQIVFTAEHGEDCLTKLQAAQAAAGPTASSAAYSDALVDVWFVDGVMPVMDGLELTRRLRRRGVKSPIVMVTGNALDEDRKSFLAAGATAVLPKPCLKLHELLAEAGLRLPCGPEDNAALTAGGSAALPAT